MDAAKKGRAIRIMDTTLRDGEQTNDVSFNPAEKLAIAKMLLKKLNVDYIEVASAKVSKGEMESTAGIMKWAHQEGMADKIEVLGFIDEDKSVCWAKEAGCKKINFLAKGSEKHAKIQLGKTLEEHLKDIEKTLDYAKAQGMKANIYLEDWSNGMINSKDYVFGLVEGISKLDVERIMLPDTLGVLSPKQTYGFVCEMKEKFPEISFDFHAHNDYGLAVANTLAAIDAGAECVHTTVNGLGERAGNASLAEVVVAVNDFSSLKCNVDEKSLLEASLLVEKFSMRRLPPNAPIVGKAVFTQTAGIHADGDNKGNLYKSRLSAERFGKKTEYSLGKLSGKASLEQNLKILGIELTKEEKSEVLKKIVELGDKKQAITNADLPFIISDVLQKQNSGRIKIKECNVSSSLRTKPMTFATVEVNGKDYSAQAYGDGGYDAFMNALKKISEQVGFKIARLTDYEVRIPPGGNTDALVETKISWQINGKSFQTVGIDSDQIIAAIKATEKMLNIVSFSENDK